MLEQAEARQGQRPHHEAFFAGRRRSRADHWERLASKAILILGSPRSGTTWLAKIFDSHPDILYRHEPDEVCDASPGLHPETQIAAWLRQRGFRVAAKRPHFAKAWRPAPVAGLRMAMAAGLAAAHHVPGVRTIAVQVRLPDLVIPWRQDTVRAAVKLVNWDGTAASRTMPGVRGVFILRHPCGQVASVMAGRMAQKFADPEELTLARVRAAAGGVDPAAFDALPEAARLAWAWVAFNEPALLGLHQVSNARIVLYEDLCREPETTARALFAFADLDWRQQTARFLDQSTNADHGAGYFDVFRAGGAVADKWRQSMRPKDQEAVRSVVATSPLSRCWDDLT